MSPVAVYVVVSRPVVPLTAKSVQAAPMQRSTVNPASFVALSVQVNWIEVFDRVVAMAAEGAAGTRVVAVAMLVGAEFPAAVAARTRYEYDC